MYPKSGYKTITGTQFLNAISLLNRQEISYRAFRVYLACFAIVAIREAASRVRKLSGKKEPVIPTFRISELSRATGAEKRAIKSDLRLLAAKNLLTFGEHQIKIQREPLDGTEELSRLVRSPSRPVPVPRALLRSLAAEKTKSKALVTIAYMIRGLTIDARTGEISGKGSVKLSWIAALTGLSERACAYARAELIRSGWMSSDTGSTQWKLNRDGAYFQINLEAEEGAPGMPPPEKKAAQIAPPPAPNCPLFAPPYKDKKTSSIEESKNQETRATKPAGVLKVERGGMPDFRNVRPENLWRFSDVESLYFQACEQGFARSSEAAALDFLAAAVRARGVKVGDPVRVFCGIIRRNLWHHLTQADEEQARRALQRFRETNPSRFRFSSRKEDTLAERAYA